MSAVEILFAYPRRAAGCLAALALACSSAASHDESAQTGSRARDPGANRTLAAEFGLEPPVVPGCGDAQLYQVSDDPGEAGPWPVGVKTATVGLFSPTTVEIWYPAVRGSEAGQEPATYDITSWLPEGQAAKLQPGDNYPQTCDCYRDLPIDDAHGPYPGVVFVHGTGSFRTASLSTMTQWASRGFVVVAADHLGFYLKDILALASLGECDGSGVLVPDLSGDIDAEIAALTEASGDFAFLGDAVDSTRLAVAGHSLGAQAAAEASTKPNVQVVIPLSTPTGSSPSPSLKSTLIVAGLADTVWDYATNTAAYQSSPAPKRLVGIEGANHLDVTDLCSVTNASGQTSIEVGNERGICGMWLLNALAQCGSMDDPKKGPEIVNYASTAALEETLHCQDRGDAFALLTTRFWEVGDSQQE
ncbi:MAG TPA: hypothetical protein VG963_02570 [Polyangiaceae bacterium]|nr:hypothetical protein [Polyangiaceae bacterium]